MFKKHDKKLVSLLITLTALFLGAVSVQAEEENAAISAQPSSETGIVLETAAEVQETVVSTIGSAGSVETAADVVSEQSIEAESALLQDSEVVSEETVTAPEVGIVGEEISSEAASAAEAGQEEFAAEEGTAADTDTAESTAEPSPADEEMAAAAAVDTESKAVEEIRVLDAVEETAPEAEEAPQEYVHILDGIDYSSVYNYFWYVDHYTDIRNAFGEDQERTLKHFVNNGMNEGRLGSGEFSVYSYRNAYQDLRTAFQKNWKRYYMHYVNNGQKEGRDQILGIAVIQNPVTVKNGTNYSPVYDYYFYIDHNTDVKAAFGDDDIRVLDHFVNNGMRETRQANEVFEVHAYRLANQDLRLAFGTDYPRYYMHYINHGAREGRTAVGVTELQNPVTVLNGKDYSKVYNFNFYTGLYPDMKKNFGNDDLAALKHFVNNGMREKRQGAENFEVVSYRNAYGDLRIAFRNDYPRYYLHYINNGAKEGRTETTGIDTLVSPVTAIDGTDYAPVYNYAFYLDRYTDLKKIFSNDDVGALLHFINNGMNEKRQAAENFNVVSYRNAHQDLRIAFRMNYPKYYLHYIRNGVKEGRDGTVGVAELQNPVTISDGVDFKNVYDYFFYIKKYSGELAPIKDDDVGVLEHFKYRGMLLDMQGKETYSKSEYSSLLKKTYADLNATQLAMVKKAQGYTSNTNYQILVNKTTHKVMVLERTNLVWKMSKYWTCTVGALSTPTPEGTFATSDRVLNFGDQYYLAWYAVAFAPDLLLHSILYRPGPTPSVVYQGDLGVNQSHGCVRLPLSGAKWIFDNITYGTKVVIYH